MDLWTMNPYESTFSWGFSMCFLWSILLSLRLFDQGLFLTSGQVAATAKVRCRKSLHSCPVKHNLREFNKCFFMVWKCCLQCFLWHKLKSCTTVGSLPGEPNCHMLDEEWRGQHVSCKVFCTIYRDVSTFGNYQASIIIHSCFCNANHRASHFTDLTGTCMRQLSEMEMCGACRKLKDFRMRYQDHENHFDSWTMG